MSKKQFSKEQVHKTYFFSWP